MINADDKTLKAIAPVMQTVLVVDPFPAAARLLVDVLKRLGARKVLMAATDAAGRRAIDDYPADLIFIEYHAAGVNGPDFVRRLRLSDAAVRKTPVIMATAEATQAALTAARDAGVHEFLCKPFTATHVLKRIEAACLRDRPWVDAKYYVGPDRRRFNSAQYRGPRKRRGEGAPTVEDRARDSVTTALRTMKAALSGFHVSPQTALRAMLDQSAELQAVAFETTNAELKAAILSLQRYLLDALEKGDLSPELIDAHAETLLALVAPAGEAAPPQNLAQVLAASAARAA